MDISAAYFKGAREHLPQAEIVFDRFQLMMLAGVALDNVRRVLTRDGADLKGGLWALSGNQWTRSPDQQPLRATLCKGYPRLGRAMMQCELLQDVLAGQNPESLDWRCARAMRCRLEPFEELAGTSAATGMAASLS